MLTIKRARLGFGCFALLSAVACSSPTGPSLDSSGATISGLVNASAAAADPSMTAATVGAELTVAIDGTGLSAVVDGGGRFRLVEVPAGDVQLRFSGANVNATTMIPNVGQYEDIELQVNIDGNSAVIVSEVRTGKVALCHRSGDGHHLIVVSVNAEGTHRAHGDAAVGEQVPNTTRLFTPGCEAKGVSIEKSTNNQDADDAPGPSVPVPSLVEWTYVVTNTSTVELTNVVVVDDQLGVVDCGKTTLAVGESMTCTASGDAVLGPYHNVGTVTAESFGGDVTDSDPSHYVGVTGDEEPGEGEKVQLCHIPPGNPDNAHTIVVGSDAVSAHLGHGDYLGACQ